MSALLTVISDTDGRFTCSCQEGYTGNGYISGIGIETLTLECRLLILMVALTAPVDIDECVL